jgi:hypothetical protein
MFWLHVAGGLFLMATIVAAAEHRTTPAESLPPLVVAKSVRGHVREAITLKILAPTSVNGEFTILLLSGVPARAVLKAMREKIKADGHGSPYRLRKQLPEPVFGQIKQARGFRQFLLRGVEKVRAEWGIVCTAHNLLKLAQRRTLSALRSVALEPGPAAA